MHTHTTLRSGHPPTYSSCPRLSWHQGSPEEASVTGTAPGGEAAPSWCPEGQGWAWACARHSLPEHPLASTEGPGSLGWAQPKTPAGWSCLDHCNAEPTVSPAPLFRAPEGDALCPQAVRGKEGWGHHSRWQKRKHGFSLTSLNGRRAGLCRAGRGWISHLDRTRSQGSLPHFFLEECWKFWWPGMEKENLRTLKSFTASGVEAFTQARW